MDLYAIAIQEENLALITLLNQGVTPRIEQVPTYLIVDATWNTEIPNEIVREDDLLRRFTKLSACYGFHHVK